MAVSRSENIRQIVLAHQYRSDEVPDFIYEECSCGAPDISGLDRGERLRVRTFFRWQSHFDEVWAREVKPLLAR
jgi:hypothetical protein